MDNQEKEKFINAIEFLSGYVTNELNNGKRKTEVIESLINKMNIERDFATQLVMKNDASREKINIFSKEYIRKNISLYVVFSILTYFSIFFIMSFVNDYEKYVSFAKILAITFFISFALCGIILKETNNIILNYVNILLSIFVSLSGFLLGGLLLFFINWNNINFIEAMGAIKAQILVSIINFVIALGPNIIGSIFIVVSLIFIGIGWKFFYDIKVKKITKES